jgi:hypothetical protein
MQDPLAAPMVCRLPARLWRRALALVALAGALGAAGCAPSEEEIERDFDAYVQRANSCSAASECGIAAVECPLGCYVPVRLDRVASVEREGRELVDDFESGGRSCDYDCPPPGEVDCVAGRCTMKSQ